MCFRIPVIKPNADSFKFERVSTSRCRPMAAHRPFGDRVMERIVAATKVTQTPAKPTLSGHRADLCPRIFARLTATATLHGASA